MYQRFSGAKEKKCALDQTALDHHYFSENQNDFCFTDAGFTVCEFFCFF